MYNQYRGGGAPEEEVEVEETEPDQNELRSLTRANRKSVRPRLSNRKARIVKTGCCRNDGGDTSDTVRGIINWVMHCGGASSVAVPSC